MSELVRAMHQVCEILYTCRKPVLTAIGGTAAGGGLSIALAGDVRIASLKASFRLAYPSVGVSMDGGSSFRFPQLIGLARTQELLYDDRVFNATEARTLGLIQEAVHPDKFEERVCQRLEQLAGGPTHAWAESKALLNPPEWVRERLEKEAEAIDRVSASQDARRAVAAFLEKRTPQFSGT
jgi:2-(1,2-epoxy-1,2-dihydrophenyl)acetyl-CoA isomerase